jgi:hypothetical protein
MLAADEPGRAEEAVHFVLAVEDLEQGVQPWELVVQPWELVVQPWELEVL